MAYILVVSSINGLILEGFMCLEVIRPINNYLVNYSNICIKTSRRKAWLACKCGRTFMSINNLDCIF